MGAKAAWDAQRRCPHANEVVYTPCARFTSTLRRSALMQDNESGEHKRGPAVAALEASARALAAAEEALAATNGELQNHEVLRASAAISLAAAKRKRAAVAKAVDSASGEL